MRQKPKKSISPHKEFPVKYNTVLFDLDGTLVDNREGIFNGFRYALGKLGREEEAERLPNDIIGPPLRSTFSDILGMDAEQTEEAVRLYREFYRPTGMYQCVVYEHVQEMLAALKEADACVCLATSKARVFAESILTHTGLMQYFYAVVGSELDGTLDNKTEVIRYLLGGVVNGAKPPVLMVGDRWHDAKGALDCGVDFAAALWGFGAREEFLPYGNVKALFDDAGGLGRWLMEE
jgi:phosphoglycolate phosphatase